MTIGDWVQSRLWVTEKGGITELDDREPSSMDLLIAEPGYVGHVVGMVDADYVTVFFERSGGVSDIHVDDLVWLGTAETGRVAR